MRFSMYDDWIADPKTLPLCAAPSWLHTWVILVFRYEQWAPGWFPSWFTWWLEEASPHTQEGLQTTRGRGRQTDSLSNKARLTREDTIGLVSVAQIICSNFGQGYMYLRYTYNTCMKKLSKWIYFSKGGKRTEHIFKVKFRLRLFPPQRELALFTLPAHLIGLNFPHKRSLRK